MGGEIHLLVGLHYFVVEAPIPNFIGKLKTYYFTMRKVSCVISDFKMSFCREVRKIGI